MEEVMIANVGDAVIPTIEVRGLKMSNPWVPLAIDAFRTTVEQFGGPEATLAMWEREGKNLQMTIDRLYKESVEVLPSNPDFANAWKSKEFLQAACGILGFM